MTLPPPDAKTVELRTAQQDAPVPYASPEIGSTILRGLERVHTAASFAPARLFDTREAPRIGRLELISHLGSGGMGDVYAAHDHELDRRVAVKIVRSDLDAPQHDASARIVREAQMMARVTHPNVVRVYDVGRVDDRVYITMEYVAGTTLRGWLERPRPWQDVVEYFLRAGRGLAAAHRTGLVHRDFKPANVLVGDDGRVLVADFGLARPLSGELDSTPSGATRPSGSTLAPSPVTAQGTVLGTPGYMSPEQMRARPVDARSDLFSFCVALFEALHGARPFAGRSTDALLASIDAGAIARPASRRGIPKRLDRALARGLSAEPARRFPTMDHLLAELERSLRRPGRIVAASLLAAGLVAGLAAADIGPFADDPPCAASGDELAATWNDDQRARLRARFAASGLDFADAMSDRTTAHLDEYTAAWSRARRDACEATLVRHDQSPQLFDRRIACLDRRRRAAEALVDTLLVADRTTVEQSVDALAALPALEPCSDAAWLTRSVEPPDSERLAAAVAEVRARIARGDALSATGHYREGLDQSSLALTAAESLDYEPVRAEALALHGRLRVQLGDLAGGEADLLAAVELAEANHHDDLGADVWLDLVRLASRQLLDPARASAWIMRARASQRRLGDPPARRIHVLGEEGIVHALAHDPDAALRSLRAALTLHATAGGDARTLAKLTHHLANALEAADRPEDARASHEQALAASAAAFGTDHPEYATTLHDFAMLQASLGELDAARRNLQRSLAIYTRSFGESHPLVGHVHITLVDVALRSEDFAQAVGHATTAARIYREALPADHPQQVDAEIAVGTARFFAGDLEAALDAFLAAAELQRRLPAPDSLVTALTACNIAETLVALARPAEALAHFAAVERLLAAAPVRDRDLEARILTGRGKIALTAGDVPRARTLLEAALELRRQLPEDPLALAELHEALHHARQG